MERLPRIYESFSKKHPKVWKAYDGLARACHQAGPLDEKNRALIKLAMSIGAKMEGAAHAHTRRALAAGATPNQIRHVALLGITTLGFPSSMAALTWIEDVLKKKRPSGTNRRKAN